MADIINNLSAELIKMQQHYFIRVSFKISKTNIQQHISVQFWNNSVNNIHIFGTTFGRISNETIFIDNYHELINVYLDPEFNNIDVIVSKKENNNYIQCQNISLNVDNLRNTEHKINNINKNITQNHKTNNTSGWRVILQNINNDILIKQISNEESDCLVCFGKNKTQIEHNDLFFTLHPQKNITIPNSCISKYVKTDNKEFEFGLFKVIPSNNQNLLQKVLISNLININNKEQFTQSKQDIFND